MKINLDLLIALCDLYKYIPSRTPNRLEIILQFVEGIVGSLPTINEQRPCNNITLRLHDEKEDDLTEFKTKYTKH